MSEMFLPKQVWNLEVKRQLIQRFMFITKEFDKYGPLALLVSVSGRGTVEFITKYSPPELLNEVHKWFMDNHNTDMSAYHMEVQEIDSDEGGEDELWKIIITFTSLER